MNAEVVAVGTELLLGQIANTNAQSISQALASIGVDVYYHTVVGDNLERIVSVLNAAGARSDAVIVTGGLGPTPDDLTSEAMARWMGVELRRDRRLVSLIEAKFEAMHRVMLESNLKQADLPAGAVPIDPEGTAPGYYLDAGTTLVFVLPGVPWEMEAMLGKVVVPLLVERSGGAITLSREIVVLGLGESLTHDAIADVVSVQSNPTIAYRAGAGRVRVRLTAKARDEAAAEALIAPVEAVIRSRLGDAALEPGVDSPVESMARVLRSRGETVAVAESLTRGLIASELAEQPGASDFFAGSIVCYSTDSKARVAKVPRELLERHGPVSPETAAALAQGAAASFEATLGLAATGVAGPARQEGHEPGTIYVGAFYRGGTESRLVRGYGDRANVTALAVTAALDLGRRVVTR